MAFIVYLSIKFFSFKKNEVPTKKNVAKLTRSEVIDELNSEDLNSSRWIEDIIQLLLDKGLIAYHELPISVQIKMEKKRQLRDRLVDGSL
jgi:hypothetical protein